MKAYTPEEFENLIRNIVIDNYDDTEERHVKMDDLICYTLRALGYGEGVKIFETVSKWYS